MKSSESTKYDTRFNSVIQGFIQDFELGGGGGGEHGGSRVVVAHESMLTHVQACVGLAACSPRKILNLDPFRLLLTQSGTRLFNICDNHTQFHDFWGGGGGEFQTPLCMKPGDLQSCNKKITRITGLP